MNTTTINWNNIKVTQGDKDNPDFALEFEMDRNEEDMERKWYDDEPDDIDINEETTNGILLDDDNDDVSDWIDNIMGDVLDDFDVIIEDD
jgi:hypothetical protein